MFSCDQAGLAQLERLSGLGAWAYDPRAGAVLVSARVRDTLGLPDTTEATLEAVLARLVSPKARNLLRARLHNLRMAPVPGQGDETDLAAPLRFDTTIATPSGKLRRVRLRAELQPAPCARVVGTLEDVTHENRDRQRLWRAANIDELTGLMNARAFQNRLHQAVRSGETLALVLLDLDGLAQVGDRLGAAQADAVLREIAAGLSGLVGEDGLVARLAGDEFMLMREDPDPDTAAQSMATRAFAALAEPFRIAASAGFALDAAAGLATRPGDAPDAEGLMRALRDALSEAKRHGPARAAFLRGETRARFEARRDAIAFVQEAVQAGRLRAYYQPKVCFASGKIVAYEALARIMAQDGTISGPEQWGPALDDVDCARRIDAGILAAVLQDLSTDAARLGRVGVNFSEFSLRDPSFADCLLAEIARHRLSPDLIELEVIETVLVGERMGPLSQGFRTLRAAGMRIALDDFGTGFASLSHLRDLPIDRIKLDKSFVLGLDQDPRNAPILRAIIALAHALDLETVAEGVETEAAVAFLRALDCGEGQGFHFGPARPFSALPALD